MGDKRGFNRRTLTRWPLATLLSAIHSATQRLCAACPVVPHKIASSSHLLRGLTSGLLAFQAKVSP